MTGFLQGPEVASVSTISEIPADPSFAVDAGPGTMRNAPRALEPVVSSDRRRGRLTREGKDGSSERSEQQVRRRPLHRFCLRSNILCLTPSFRLNVLRSVLWGHVGG